MTNWMKLPKEKMIWQEVEYTYEATMVHCTEKLQSEGKSVKHVGMHAAQLWLYRASGLSTSKREMNGIQKLREEWIGV